MTGKRRTDQRRKRFFSANYTLLEIFAKYGNGQCSWKRQWWGHQERRGGGGGARRRVIHFLYLMIYLDLFLYLCFIFLWLPLAYRYICASVFWLGYRFPCKIMISGGVSELVIHRRAPIAWGQSDLSLLRNLQKLVNLQAKPFSELQKSFVPCFVSHLFYAVGIAQFAKDFFPENSVLF